MVLVCIPPLTTQHQRSCESPFFLKRNHSAHTHYCCNDKHISLLAKMIIIYAILIRNASPFAHQLGIAFGTRKPFDTRKQVSLNKLSYNDPSIKVWWRFIVHCVQDVPYRRFAPSMWILSSLLSTRAKRQSHIPWVHATRRSSSRSPTPAHSQPSSDGTQHYYERMMRSAPAPCVSMPSPDRLSTHHTPIHKYNRTAKQTHFGQRTFNKQKIIATILQKPFLWRYTYTNRVMRFLKCCTNDAIWRGEMQMQQLQHMEWYNSDRIIRSVVLISYF